MIAVFIDDERDTGIGSAGYILFISDIDS